MIANLSSCRSPHTTGRAAYRARAGSTYAASYRRWPGTCRRARLGGVHGSGAAAVATVLAVADYNGIGPGLGAFLVVTAIAVATVFLIRSMNKQLKKIDFEEKPPSGPSRDGRGTSSHRP